LFAGLARGEAPVTRDLAARILAEFAHGARTDTPHAAIGGTPDSLTERQIEVLQRMAQGQTNQEIAAEMFITERTVKYHIREILQKLHLRNRVQAVAYAVHTGMISVG
jgi:DNA-binding NarL/FixJ family response regulator